MENKRILMVHNYYQIAGGEDTVVMNEKKMLEENGHEVIMYTRHNDEIKEMGLLKKIMIPFQTIYSLKTKREIKKIIKENKIDIVHVHNTLPLISPSIYKAAKECGAKVVQTIHNFRLVCPGATFYRNDHICEDCISKGLKCAIKHKCYRNSKIQTLVSVMMLKFNRLIGSYDKVDAYIALTEFNKEKLSSIIPKEKIYVKPNFTEEPKVSIVPAEEREYFMFLGRVDKLKGINLLLQEWKNIKNEKLIVVGTGPEEEWCKDFIKKNRINNIEMVGFKKKEEAMELLSKAKALIVPSLWYEGFPMTVVESYSMGVPVLANNIGNLASLIQDFQNGALFSFESGDFLSKLQLLVGKGDDSRKLCKRTKEIYDNELTESINYLELKKIYKLD